MDAEFRLLIIREKKKKRRRKEEFLPLSKELILIFEKVFYVKFVAKFLRCFDLVKISPRQVSAPKYGKIEFLQHFFLFLNQFIFQTIAIFCASSSKRVLVHLIRPLCYRLLALDPHSVHAFFWERRLTVLYFEYYSV